MNQDLALQKGIHCMFKLQLPRDLTVNDVRSMVLSALRDDLDPKSTLITAGFLVAAAPDIGPVSLRQIAQKAGYSTSILYRHWVGRSDFFVDAYLHCVKAYIRSEHAYARSYQGDSAQEFFERIAWHAVLAQRLTSADLFREIAIEHNEGNYSRLLSFAEHQILGHLEIFKEKFPNLRTAVNTDLIVRAGLAFGTFIFARNHDLGLQKITDEEAVELMVLHYLTLFGVKA